MGRMVFTARHGHRQDNADTDWGKYAKWPDDPELSELGTRQAEELAQRLRGVSIDHIFSSHFLRTLQTAYPASEILGKRIKLETGFGEWMKQEWFQSEPDLMPLQYKMSLFPRVDRCYRPFLRAAIPETRDDLERRIVATVRHVLDTAGGDILIFGHGGTVEGVHFALTNERPAPNSELCCLNRYVECGGGWKLAASWAASPA